MSRPQIILLLFVFILSLGWLSSSSVWKRDKTILPSNTFAGNRPAVHSIEKAKAAEAKKFIAENHFTATTCFLVNMNLPSGQNRFFVYDLKTDSVLRSGLVTHGRCNEDWLNERKYGNSIGCGCTSLGKYRIGNSYNGRFGLAFKLYGLDSTNDKAFSRFVVLHSHQCVPETEVPGDICQSDGCPTVAPGFLQQLKSIINASKKPVLLWIYE